MGNSLPLGLQQLKLYPPNVFYRPKAFTFTISSLINSIYQDRPLAVGWCFMFH